MGCRLLRVCHGCNSARRAGGVSPLIPWVIRGLTPPARHLWFLMWHFSYLATRLQTPQELPRCLAIELGICPFDAQEKAILRRMDETRHVEHRVIRHGQTV